MALKRLLKPYVARFPSVLATYRYGAALARFGQSRPATTPYGFSWRAFPWMTFERFEIEEVRFLESAFKACDLFLDIGANCGMYSCLAASTGVPVIAVEPLPENLRYLYANIKENGWSDRIEVFPLGVGERPGVLELYGESAGASLVPGWGGNDPLGHTISVSTIDTLVAGRAGGRRLVVKMDIEGAELLALQGARRTLALRPAPVWMLEVCLTEHHPDSLNPHFGAVFETFWAAGYTAQTVESSPRQVTEADVLRWVKNRRRDFGGETFSFASTE